MPDQNIAIADSISCPGCGESDQRPFYSVENIPCHSVLLMETQQQAESYPRADLQLSFCGNCGFIWNTIFDPSRNDYSVSYEETQHFSARFNSFAHELVTELIERHGIRQKHVLEIGCGKGEFLGLLCELGDNTGTGIDPGCRPERFPPAWQSRIQIIQDLYSEHYTHLKADVICCRHTLEHIGPVSEFLTTVRKSIGDRHDTLLFFEVPDIRIVLDQSRFWDIYYEHCSYFSLGSLARLFRRCSFDIVSLERAFDDQYALIVARPSQHATSSNLPEEDDLGEVSERVSKFAASSTTAITHWRSLLKQFHQRGKRVAVWGAGSKCVAFLTTTGIGPEVTSVIDINPYKQGRFLPGTGHRVSSPEALTAHPPDVVLLMNSVYEQEVRQSLASMHLYPELVAVE